MGGRTNSAYVMLASSYKELKDYYNAKKYYEIVCDTSDSSAELPLQAYACTVVGEMYQMGLGVKQNDSTAEQYYGKACNLGNQRACSELKIRAFIRSPLGEEAKIESQRRKLELQRQEIELKKLELQNKELEQKLQKYK